ncbi:MAG: NUDIX hydrolase [Paludibacter sp.]
MKKLRKQIKESFFNPIFHLTPLLIFLVLDEFYGMDTAWKISFPVVMMLILYVYYAINNTFTWHLIFTFMFMSVGIVSSVAILLPIPFFLQHLEEKLAVLTFLLVFLVFRKQIQKTISRVVPKLIPMSNNFNELYRVIWALSLLILFYIVGNVVVSIIKGNQTALYHELIQTIYLAVVVFLVAYEIIRVQIIRANLVREEWWPIVSDQGKIIGSIQHLTSLNDEKKYLHPIVRVHFIDKGKIFLQKRSAKDLIFPGLWDTAISNHVRMGETIEQCVDRTALERYDIKEFKYMYLSNYKSETEHELHYGFLFVSCLLTDFTPNPTFVEQTKWWTIQQIEDNLKTGIFSENFKIEFDLLKRSGLLETGKCECNCKLKDVIYHQPILNKKE